MVGIHICQRINISTKQESLISVQNPNPDHAAECGTKNESITMDTTSLEMSHISLHARIIPTQNKKLLFCINDHNSRNGLGLLEKAKLFKIDVMQSPVKTTYFSQLCDDEINRAFQKAVRSTQNYLNSVAHFNFAEI